MMQNQSALQEYYSSDQQVQHQDYRQSALTKSFSETLRETVTALNQLTTNITYNFKHSSISILPNQRKPITLNPDNNEEAWLLGKKYQSSQDEIFKQHFQKTIWISYRKGMKGQDGDVGWGCMIRVAQMLLAQVYRRLHPEMCSREIISLFRQDERASFSFQKICHQGNIEKRWTSSLQLFAILQQLETAKLLGQNNQTRKCLHFDIYNSGITIERPVKFNKYLQKETKDKAYPKLVAISNRVGINSIPEKLFPHMKYLMSNRSFAGLMGGISRQALYIIGHYEDRAIVLDPHYVQSSEDQFSQVYFKSTPRGIRFSQLSPSLTYCYYIQNQNQHVEWARFLVEGSLLYEENLVFELKVESMREWIQTRKISDQFEQL